MIKLYRHNGSVPAELPSVAYDEEGNAYTPPYRSTDLKTLGFVLAPKKPEDTETQTVDWDLGAEKWVMIDRPVPPPPPLPTDDDVNAERIQRIEAGCTVTVSGAGAIPVTGTDQDTRNMLGLVQAASLRVNSGDFQTITGFRDAKNIMHDLNPLQMIELWQKGAAYVSAVYEASWALKEGTIPVDYADDSYWPPR